MSNSFRNIVRTYEDLRDEIKTMREGSKSLREENKSLRDNNMSLRDEMRMMNGTMTSTAVKPTNVKSVTEVPTDIDSDVNELIGTKKMSIEAVVNLPTH